MVHNQHYKLAKVYLMQCYSGITHEFTREETYKKIKEKWEQQRNAKIIPDELYQRRIKIPQETILRHYLPSFERKYKNFAANTPGITYIKYRIYREKIVFYFKGNWKTAWGQHIVGGAPTMSYEGENIAGLDI